jgi:hypothetical protein
MSQIPDNLILVVSGGVDGFECIPVPVVLQGFLSCLLKEAWAKIGKSIVDGPGWHFSNNFQQFCEQTVVTIF